MSNYRRPEPKLITLRLPGWGKTDVLYAKGPRGTPTNVLVHGLSASRKIGWRNELVDELSMRSTVVAMDLPGHAGAPGPLGNDYIEDASNFTIAICEQLDVESAIITGHSMGSAVAVTTALKKPSLVEGIITIGGALRFVNAKDLASLFKSLPGVVLSPAMTLSYLPALQNLGPGSIRAIKDLAADLSKHDWGVVGKAAISCKNYDCRADAKRLQCPVYVIIPSGDKVVPRYTQYEAAELIPNSAAVFIDGTHLCVWSDPKAVADAMIVGMRRIKQMQHKQQRDAGGIEEVA